MLQNSSRPRVCFVSTCCGLTNLESERQHWLHDADCLHSAGLQSPALEGSSGSYLRSTASQIVLSMKLSPNPRRMPGRISMPLPSYTATMTTATIGRLSRV